MDQIRIGRFISQERKSHNLTQMQLADALSISDKTVSKWECGKGLPDPSLMLPLCETLGFTVNELLSGERVSQVDYRTKAEENIMDLIRENNENRKRLALSVICGVITIIAVLSLVIIASFIDMSVPLRIAVLVFAVATGVTGVGAACLLDIRAGHFECPFCGELFVPTTKEYVKGYHTLTKRCLTCPKCNKRGMCIHSIVR